MSSHGFTYRPALDGLRGIAVLVVIIYHLNEQWLPGGFLGVDVFFVLSGYLITSLLLIEWQNTGKVAFAAFWTRRARRLLPALFLVVVVVAIAAILADPAERSVRRGDLIATLLYVVNWHFIVNGVSYFTDFLGASPVRHLWSLAIEEQFYLFWPVVFSTTVRGGGRRRLTMIAGFGFLVSVLLLALTFDPADPSRAYYGTDSRIHEILGGVLLAVFLTGKGRGRIAAWVPKLGLPAFLVLLVAFIVLPDSSPAYYFGVSTAVTAAVLLVILSTEIRSILTRPLSFAPLVGIGKISYGLYLWHWPMILWMTPESVGLEGVSLAVAQGAATLAVSLVSYRLIERPIRRGEWKWVTFTPRNVGWLSPLAAALVAVVVLASTTGGDPLPDWAEEQTVVRVAAPVTTTAVTHAEPTDDPLEASPTSPTTSPAPLPPSVAVIGDSVAVSLLPGLRAEASDRGWTLVEAAFPACPVGYSPLYDAAGDPSPYNERCLDQVAEGHRTVLDEYDPNIVIWHDLQSVLSRRDDNGDLLVAGTSEWEEDLLGEWELIVDEFRAGGAMVAILLPPLRSVDPPGACHLSANPPRCQDIQAQDEAIRTATLALAANHASDPGFLLVTLDDVLCPAGYPCPVAVDGLEPRTSGNDQTHFSEPGAAFVAPLLLDLIETNWTDWQSVG